jgi:ferritin-like metal-binding protein YciE
MAVITIDLGYGSRVVQDAAADLVREGEMSVLAFRRAWIRDLGRLARAYQEDWEISAYAVQVIRQLRGQLPIE